MYSLQELNEMNKSTFIKTFGFIFEHSPWIMERVWYARPFSTIDELHEVMKSVVEVSNKNEILSLIQGHPDLGTKLQMSSTSQKEQKGAGLDQLTPIEYEKFLSLNHQYKEKFGFPFIIAVRNHTKESIYENMKKRIHQPKREEYKRALGEIFNIAKFRLEDLLK